MIPFYSAWWDDWFDILKVMIRHKNTTVWVSQSTKKIVFSVIYALVVEEGNNFLSFENSLLPWYFLNGIDDIRLLWIF